MEQRIGVLERMNFHSESVMHILLQNKILYTLHR